MIQNMIHSPEFIDAVKLLLALVCGGILGIEREQKKRPAGFRTYMLVCVGATLVMITNHGLYGVFSGIDVTRMGAQVISGIGFLGAGTIIVTGKNTVKGLTTAAGLWATACVGLAIGAGNYYAGIFVTIVIFLVMRFMQIFDKKLGMNTKIINIYIEFNDIINVSTFIRKLRKDKVKINDLEINTSSKVAEGTTIVLISLQFPQKENHNCIIERFSAMEGVIYVEEI